MGIKNPPDRGSLSKLPPPVENAGRRYRLLLVRLILEQLQFLLGVDAVNFDPGRGAAD